MSYTIQDICCFCLSIANEKCSIKSSKYPDNLTPFDKIKTVLIELSAVMCSDSRICKSCSKNVDFIYEFNKTCLRNINILNSYKKVLKENKPEKQCELFVNLDEWKQFKDKLVSEVTEIGSSESPLKNNDTLCDADFVSESHSSDIAEDKEENQINYVNCDEESERSWLGSKVKVEIEEMDLKQEWTSEISDPLMDESLKSTVRGNFLNPHFLDFENFPVRSVEGVVVKKKEDSNLVEQRLEVAEENSAEKLGNSESQVEQQSNSFHKISIQADNQDFNLDRLMLSHSKTKSHTEKRAHECETCGKLFTRKVDFSRHILTHTGEKPHKCDTCGKAFNQKSNLRTHMLVHTGEKPHKCEICGKLFIINSNLKKHMLIHTGEKPHKCGTCGKSFIHMSDLNRHLLIHTGEKPHECDVCGRSFTRKWHFESHMLIHTDESPYKCDICGKSFTRKDGLESHMLVHTGEKPHKCEVCGKFFSHKFNLRSHMRTHTGEKPHKCDICGKLFSLKSHVKRHNILVHKAENNHK